MTEKPAPYFTLDELLDGKPVPEGASVFDAWVPDMGKRLGEVTKADLGERLEELEFILGQQEKKL